MTSPQNDASAGSSQLGRSAAELGDKVQETAGRVAESQLSKQKETASGTLEQVAEALRMTGDQLRASRHEQVARYAQQASDQVRRLSESIRDAQPRDVLRRVEDVARREPALFLGGAFLLGLIGARFLKSSERSPDTGRGTPRFPPLDRAEGVQPYSASRVGAGLSGGVVEDEELGIRSDESNIGAREH
ncbi:MAG: hypothetical protein EHM78_27320 [Myxococcaceae bacterium]|nr:MAG: hypothetical protein EHM78_27320 [Myxococcaceae bacterium]